MKNETKRKLKNTARTLGKTALRGSLYTGKAVMATTRSLAKNQLVKELAVMGGMAAATVMFAPELLMLGGMKYAVDKCVLGKNKDFISEAQGIFRGMHDLLDAPTKLIADLVAEAARGGEKIAQKGLDATR